MDELIKAVRDLQAGDAEAFQTIYEKTCRHTRAHIRRYCDDEDQCEDFLQETYMQLYKNINQLENPEALQGWLNTTAKRLVGRRAEKDSKLPTQTFSSLDTEDGSEPDFEDEREESNPELISDRKAVAEIVNQILEMLPKEQRDALMMVYGQKVTIKEMAAQLEISENTIKSRLLQGRRKLMEHKADFRRLGVELPAVGIAALIAVTYEENLAAQAAVGAASGTATISEAAASGTTAASTASAAASSTTATATAAAAATTATAAKAAGTGLAVKLLAGAAAVAVAGGIAAGVVTSKSHSDSGPAQSIEAAADMSTDSAEDTQAADINAGVPLDVELSTEETAALNDLITYADEANNTDRYLAEYLLNNYELIASLYEKLPDKEAMYTGEGFVQGTTGTGVYLKSNSEIYVGGLKDGLPEGYGCLARLIISSEFCYVDGDESYDVTYIVPCIDGKGYTGYWANGKANGHGYSYNLGPNIFFNTDGLVLHSESTEEIVEPNRLFIGLIPRREGTFADDLGDGEYLAHSGSTDRVIPLNKGQVDESRLGDSSLEIVDIYEGIKEYKIRWEQGRISGYMVYPELGGLGNNCRWDDRDTWDQTDTFIRDAMPIRFDNGLYFNEIDVDLLNDIAMRAGYDRQAAWHYLEKLSEAMNASLNKDSYMYGGKMMPITDGTITVKLEDYDGGEGTVYVFTYSAADDTCTVTIE